MIVLGIETASRTCSAAVVDSGKVLSLERVAEPRAHAEMLLDLISGALTSARRDLASVDGFAVSIGPGSFTGLRVGLSVVKGFSWSLGKPIVGVPTLKALAVGAARSGSWTGGLLLTAVDARRGELYCQLFDTERGAITPLWDERVLSLARVQNDLLRQDVLIAGDSEEIRKTLPLMKKRWFVSSDGPFCGAAAVALEGEARLVDGDHDDPVTLEPRYVAEFVPRVLSKKH